MISDERACDMSRFIYVFNADDKDVLAKNGFMLLSSDERNNVYVFAQRPEMTLCLADIQYMESDELTL